MISIDKLVQQLQQCKDTSITLPSTTDFKFIQNTALDIRKSELELLNNNFEQLNEANYTMDGEIEKLNNNLQSGKEINSNSGSGSGSNNHNTHNNSDNVIIPNKSLIIYMENETANIPEILIKLLPYELFNPNEWYIYGVKNPESFYKSFLLLSKVDFIIKNKTEKKNEVATFKREMALQYETLYKSLNYRKLRFPRNEMVNNLTNIDNYTEYDVLQYISDYSKVNYIILDIINEKYIDIKYNNNNNIYYSTSETNTISNIEFAIIIKYASNTYLPLMNSNGKHGFNKSILTIISKHFERIVQNKFKEPKDLNTEDFETSEDTEIDLENPVQKQLEINPSYNIEDIYNANANTNTNTNVYGLQNNIDNNTSNNESLINSPNVNNNNTIDSIINNITDIEEQEEEPMGLKTNITTTSTTVPTVKNEKFFGNSYGYNKNYDNTKIYDNAKKCNDIESLLSRVPMSCDIKPKKTKKDIAIEEKLAKNAEIKKAQDVNNTTTNSDKEELKPLAKYNLVDLQILAKLYKIDTQKMGNCDKKINKLKGELYEEIKKKM